MHRLSSASTKPEYTNCLWTVAVEAKSYLAIYQQKFNAPGVEVMCKALTTNPDTAKEVTAVTIIYTAQAVQFIKDITVSFPLPFSSL